MTEPSPASYSLFGCPPLSVECPATVAESQAAVRRSAGQTIVPWGGGTRQALGFAPTGYDVALSTARLTEIVDYVPENLTVTCGAGLTISALQETLAAQGQWLPLDVACPDRQTLGGIVAARAGSLRRLGAGSVRDLLLGVTVVNSAGEIIQGGGRVVKNVSGYDLPKLYCGSLGTLGLIAEVTFRVAPLPPASATALLPLDANHNSEDVLDALLGSDLSPAFLFLLSPEAAQTIVPGAEDAQYVAVGFDGDPEAVAWQIETLGAGQLQDDTAQTVRARLRDFSLDDAPLTASFHILSSQVGAFSRMVEWTARRAGFTAAVASDAALGLMTAHFAPACDDADWRVFYTDLKDKADRCGGSFILEKMPDILRADAVPVWSPLLPDFGLMASVKVAVDPAQMWNPGRFVGGL